MPGHRDDFLSSSVASSDKFEARTADGSGDFEGNSDREVCLQK